MSEKPNYPYVEFKTLKKMTSKADPNGIETAESWFLRVAGVHNNPQKITNYLKTKKHKLIGHGNLSDSKFNDLRNYVDSTLGIGVDSRLFSDEPPKALKEKVENERQARATRA